MSLVFAENILNTVQLLVSFKGASPPTPFFLPSGMTLDEIILRLPSRNNHPYLYGTSIAQGPQPLLLLTIINFVPYM